MRAWLEKLNDPSRNVYERRYRLLSAVSILTLVLWVLFAWIVDGYSVRILFFGLCALLFIPTMIYTLRSGRIQLGAGASGFVLVFLMLPFAFFYNGGIYAGAPNWCIITLIFVTLTIRGRLRTFLLISDAAVTVICYVLTWKYPSLVDPYTVASAYADSLSSLIITAVLTSVMFLFQMYMAGQERDKMEEQQKEILELNRAQNRFFSSMSHEIRTPVNTIIGLNEMILREDISGEVAEDAEQVRSAGNMLLHLINDILDMSKLESDRMELAEDVYSVGNMLSDIVNMIWIHAQKKDLAFHVDIDPSLPARLYGDEIRVKQILINLLNNAVKYTEKGSVTLSVQESQIDGRDYIVYVIRDTGTGIRKEDIPYLFTAFKRVESSENQKIEGTGLGLSIVKQLVDKMGGTVRVNSIYTQGSAFTVELPEKKAGEETVGLLQMEKRHTLNKNKKYVPGFSAPKAKILVVDDNASNLMVVEKMLRDTQVQVVSASSGSEALEKTMTNAFDLIFMDHLMPRMDGVTCLQKIRTQTGGMSKEAKAVALTANTESGSRQMYAKEGFSGYLAKPISGAALEQECIRLLPHDMVRITADGNGIVASSVLWMQEHEKREDIRVTTDSIADLPRSLIDQYRLGIIPHAVHTSEGIFLDGEEINAQGIIPYMENREKTAATVPPEKSDYETFFARELSRANYLIHISISQKVPGSGYLNAKEAAGSFQNVAVIDSGHLSSGEGLLAVEAARLVKEGLGPEAIIEKLDLLKAKIHTSFIVDGLDHMERAKLVGKNIAKLSGALMTRPVLKLRNGEISIGNIYLGSRKSAWKKYIDSELRQINSIDRKLLFVTYVGLTQEELSEIRREIDKKAAFDMIIFQQASPAIAVNCGPGTFGLLYIGKTSV